MLELKIDNVALIVESKTGQCDFRLPASFVNEIGNSLVVRRILFSRFGVVSVKIMVYQNGRLIAENDEIQSSFCNSLVQVFDCDYGRFVILVNTDIYDNFLLSVIEKTDCDFAIVAVDKSMKNDADNLFVGVPLLVVLDDDFYFCEK